jgi:hypothetical protein
MAALESTRFVLFAFPLLNLPLFKRNTLWTTKPSRLIRLPNSSGSQKVYRLAATLFRSGYRIEADRNTVARAEGMLKICTESESF